MRRAARLLSVAAVVLTSAAPAAGAGKHGRLVAAGSTTAKPFGDGVHLVFAATPQRIVSRDPRLHRSRTFAFDGGCIVAGAAAGVALVTCQLPRDASDGGRASYEQAFLVSLGTGRRWPIATRDGQPAGTVPSGEPQFEIERFDGLGGQWLHAETGIEGCYHCEAEEFVNWHTGERRQRATYPTPPPPVDLDDRGLRRLPAATRRARVLAQCAGECPQVVTHRDRVAWIQRLGHGARARWTVRSAHVQGGRIATWPLPTQRCAAGDTPIAAFADGGLYVSGCRAPHRTGPRPLYHAR